MTIEDRDFAETPAQPKPSPGWRFTRQRLWRAFRDLRVGTAAAAKLTSSRLPSRAVLVCALAFAAFAFLLYGQSGQDDTYITYWPARTLAEHGRIWNYNGIRLEQSSSLSLVVVLAILYKLLPLSMPAVGFLSSLGFGVLTILLAERVAYRLGIRPSGAVAPVIATVACFGSWATSGMETTLVTASGLWMILELDSLGTNASWVRASLIPALSVLLFAASRPEAPIIVGSVVAGGMAAMLLARSGAGGYEMVRRVWRAVRLVSVAGVPIVALFGFRLLYFHAWLPNPATMKLAGFNVSDGLWYLWDSFSLNGFVLLALAVFGLLSLAARLAWRRQVTVLTAMIGAEMVGHLGFAVISGGDWMSGCRFLAPAIPTLVILGLAAASPWIRAGSRVWVLSLVVAASNLLTSAQFVRLGANDGRPGFLLRPATARFRHKVESSLELSPIELANKIHERDAATLSRFLPIVDRVIASRDRPIWVVTGQAGMMGYHLMSRYFGKAKLMDLWSLTTRELTDCLPRGMVSGTRLGNLIGLEQYLSIAPDIQKSCGLPPPDLYYNECIDDEGKRMLARHGYRVLYDQRGEVHDIEGSRLLPAGIAACGSFAVREDLANALGLDAETDWVWNANPR